MTGAKIMRITTGIPLYDAAGHWTATGPALASPFRGISWPSATLVADAPPEYIAAVDAWPRPEIHAGIHAYRTLRAAVAARYTPGQSDSIPDEWMTAYAILQASGEAILGTIGWTAAAATIVRIFLPPALYARYARDLYDRYRVPVVVLPRSLALPPAPTPAAAPPVPGRTAAGVEWLRLHMPCAAPSRLHDAGAVLRRLSLVNADHRCPLHTGGGPLVSYDASFAATQIARAQLERESKRREATERWTREAREREERDRLAAQRRREDERAALELLRPYLPIRTVRVSSAQAQGAAKQYSYWGATRYQIRATADGKAAANIARERASSDRRSERLASQDAEDIAAAEKRIVVQRIGRISLDLARELAAKIGRLADGQEVSRG